MSWNSMKWAIKEPLKQRFVCCAASMMKKQRCNLPGALTGTNYGCSMGVATAGNLGGSPNVRGRSLLGIQKV